MKRLQDSMQWIKNDLLNQLGGCMNLALREYLIDNKNKFIKTKDLLDFIDSGGNPKVCKDIREIMDAELLKPRPEFFFGGCRKGCICTNQPELIDECIRFALNSALDRLKHVQDLQLTKYRMFTKNEIVEQLEVL